MLDKLAFAIVQTLEVPTVMARSATVSRPRAVTVERRPRLRAAAGVFTEIRETSEKEKDSRQKDNSVNKSLNGICSGNEVIKAHHAGDVNSKPGGYLPVKHNLHFDTIQRERKTAPVFV